MPDLSFDLIVIGGAASGGTMALRMARAGWKVAVVERAPYPRRKVCGEFLSATNQPLFDDLDLTQFVSEHAGTPIDAVAVYSEDQIITAPMPRVRGAAGLRGLALGRDILDEELIRRARNHGATVFQPARATSLNTMEDGSHAVTVQTGDETNVLTAPLLVAAHGSWGASSLPTFPEAQPSSPNDLFGFKAHFANAALPKGLMPCFVFPGGYGGLVESSGQKISFSCCVRRDDLQHIRRTHAGLPPGESVVAHLVETLRGMREVLGIADVCGAILSTGPIRPGIRQTFADGVFRVGNAAGEAHPIIAEGITMAMQSSWILSEAWIRAGRHADPAAVARVYARTWKRAFATRIRASFLFASMAMNPVVTRSLARIYQTFPQILTACAGASGKSTVVVRTRQPQAA